MRPIVGDNAFAHEAGIHQDGVLKNKSTYEIMRPETIGIASNRLVLGKHSGRHAFVMRLKELGVDIPGVDMNAAFERFKTLCDKKKDIFDEDLLTIVAEGQGRAADRYELVFLNVTSSTHDQPRADVRVLARLQRGRGLGRSRCTRVRGSRTWSGPSHGSGTHV